MIMDKIAYQLPEGTHSGWQTFNLIVRLGPIPESLRKAISDSLQVA